ncbi:MAG: PAS domain S-box protein [Candidatus Thermoplasmatota archaeon]
MGDTRFETTYARVRDAVDQTRELLMLSDIDVIAAIAGASRERDPYLANVLATEAMNRTHLKSAIIEAAGEGMLAVNRDLVVTFVNRAARLKLGLPLHQEVHVPLDDVLVCGNARGEQVRPHEHPVATALRGIQTPEAVEGCIRLHDGSSFHASWMSAPIRVGDEVEGAVLVFRDISGRHKADEALRDSERLLRTVVTGAPIILFGLGNDGRFTLAEGRALESVGGKPSDIVGLSASELDVMGFGIEDAARRVLSGETVEAMIDVAGYTFQTNWVPVREEGGEVSGAVGVATDITGLRRAEESARKIARSAYENEQRFRSLFEQSMDGLIAVDLDGAITDANRAYCEMLGYTREELIGKRALDLIVPELREANVTEARRSLAGQPHLQAAVVVRKDGSCIEVRGTARPIIVDGKVVGTFGVARPAAPP